MNEVSLRCGFADSVNRNDFVLFGMVGTNSHEIVSFGVFELKMGNVSLELETDSESLFILF